MSKICIISCGNKKIWSKEPNKKSVPASEAYIGSYFNKNKTYAELKYDDYFILSAKYGLLHKDTLIENYNVSFNDKKTNPITVEELSKQYNGDDTLVILAGKNYVDMIKKAFPNKIETPLSEFKGIGYQLQFLTEEINKMKEEK